MSVHARPERIVLLDPYAAERLKEERRKSGADRWDEVWEGDLHMSPPPEGEHSRVELELAAFVIPLIKERDLGRILRLGVRKPGSGEKNYRIPEFVFVSKARLHLVEGCWLNGGPDVAFEIRSPGDETYDKLDFYGEVGTGELVIVDRDTKRVELLRLVGARLLPVSPAADGAVYCQALGVGFRRLEREGRGVLEAFVAGDPARRVEI